jgi:hypothetical protein
VAAEPSPMCWSGCSWLKHGDASFKVAEVGAEADVEVERPRAWRKVGQQRYKHARDDDERATS